MLLLNVDGVAREGVEGRGLVTAGIPREKLFKDVADLLNGVFNT